MALKPDEVPDRTVHRMCVRCHQWCWPHEEADYVLPRVGALSAARELSGLGRPATFMCFNSRRRHVVLCFWIWGILIGMIVLALLYRLINPR